MLVNWSQNFKLYPSTLDKVIVKVDHTQIIYTYIYVEILRSKLHQVH